MTAVVAKHRKGRAAVAPRPPAFAMALIIGAVLLLLLVVASIAVPDPSAFNWLGAVLLLPILIIVTMPFLKRQRLREEDRRLYTLLMFALVLKLIGAIARYYFAYGIYAGKADATAYDRNGVVLMSMFRGGHFDLGSLRFTGTMFIDILTGIVYTIIGPTKMG